MTAAPVFVVRGLSVAYGGRVVLSGVDLDIAARGVTALVGPSGCGKSSFLSSLNRLTDLVPSCQVDGSVRFEGREIAAATADEVRGLRCAVGMVFQRPQPFPVSVRQNLHLPLREFGCRRASERDALAEEALRRVGLWDEVCDRLGRSALQLSGGQQQRLCLARALLLQPRVLLMDEPCSALDPYASARIERLIAELAEDIACVVVTHNLAQAQRLADDLAVFWQRDGVGCLAEAGPAARLFAQPRDADAAGYLTGARG